MEGSPRRSPSERPISRVARRSVIPLKQNNSMLLTGSAGRSSGQRQIVPSFGDCPTPSLGMTPTTTSSSKRGEPDESESLERELFFDEPVVEDTMSARKRRSRSARRAISSEVTDLSPKSREVEGDGDVAVLKESSSLPLLILPVE